MTNPEEQYLNQGWYEFRPDSPSFVHEWRPASPRLGQQRHQISTMPSGNLLVVAFNNDPKPLAWRVLDNFYD